MKDDGLTSDSTPGDGFFSGVAQVPMSGTYIIEAKLDGHYIDSSLLSETYGCMTAYLILLGFSSALLNI